MVFSTNLITQLIEFINKDDQLSLLGKAIRAYDTEGLPVPIRETYFSFSCEKNSLVIIENEDGSKGEENKIAIRLNCFSPLKGSAYGAHSIAEKVTHGLCEEFRDAITSFSVGDTQYDNDVKSYKISAVINFIYTV